MERVSPNHAGGAEIIGMVEDDLLVHIGRVTRSIPDKLTYLRDKVKESTKRKAKFGTFFPISYWLPLYFSKKSLVKENSEDVTMKEGVTIPNTFGTISYSSSFLQRVINDFFAGVSISAILIPQTIIFSYLAEVHCLVGLYSSIVMTVVYLISGASRHCGVGMFAILSVLMVEAKNILQAKLETIEEAKGVFDYDSLAFKLQVNTAISINVGLIFFIGSLLRIGYIKSLISNSVSTGISLSVGLIISFSQLESGLELPQTKKLIFERIYYILRNIQNINKLAATLALGSFISVLLIKSSSKRWLPKYVIPAEMIVIVLFSSIAQFVSPLEVIQPIEPIVKDIIVEDPVTMIEKLNQISKHRRLVETEPSSVALDYEQEKIASSAKLANGIYNILGDCFEGDSSINDVTASGIIPMSEKAERGGRIPVALPLSTMFDRDVSLKEYIMGGEKYGKVLELNESSKYLKYKIRRELTYPLSLWRQIKPILDRKEEHIESFDTSVDELINDCNNLSKEHRPRLLPGCKENLLGSIVAQLKNCTYSTIRSSIGGLRHITLINLVSSKSNDKHSKDQNHSTTLGVIEVRGIQDWTPKQITKPFRYNSAGLRDLFEKLSHEIKEYEFFTEGRANREQIIEKVIFIKKQLQEVQDILLQNKGRLVIKRDISGNEINEHEQNSLNRPIKYLTDDDINVFIYLKNLTVNCLIKQENSYRSVIKQIIGRLSQKMKYYLFRSGDVESKAKPKCIEDELKSYLENIDIKPLENERRRLQVNYNHYGVDSYEGAILVSSDKIAKPSVEPGWRRLEVRHKKQVVERRLCKDTDTKKGSSGGMSYTSSVGTTCLKVLRKFNWAAVSKFFSRKESRGRKSNEESTQRVYKEVSYSRLIPLLERQSRALLGSRANSIYPVFEPFEGPKKNCLDIYLYPYERFNIEQERRIAKHYYKQYRSTGSQSSKQMDLRGTLTTSKILSATDSLTSSEQPRPIKRVNSKLSSHWSEESKNIPSISSENHILPSPRELNVVDRFSMLSNEYLSGNISQDKSSDILDKSLNKNNTEVDKPSIELYTLASDSTRKPSKGFYGRRLQNLNKPDTRILGSGNETSRVQDKKDKKNGKYSLIRLNLGSSDEHPPMFQIPNLDLYKFVPYELFIRSIMVAIITSLAVITNTGIITKYYSYDLTLDQEFRSIGLMNILVAFTSPIGGGLSFSRTLILIGANPSSIAHNLVTLVLLILAAIWAKYILIYLPQSVLSGVMIAAFSKLIIDSAKDGLAYLKTSFADSVFFLLSVILPMVMMMNQGMILAMLLSLLFMSLNPNTPGIKSVGMIKLSPRLFNTLSRGYLTKTEFESCLRIPNNLDLKTITKRDSEQNSKKDKSKKLNKVCSCTEGLRSNLTVLGEDSPVNIDPEALGDGLNQNRIELGTDICSNINETDIVQYNEMKKSISNKSVNYKDTIEVKDLYKSKSVDLDEEHDADTRLLSSHSLNDNKNFSSRVISSLSSKKQNTILNTSDLLKNLTYESKIMDRFDNEVLLYDKSKIDWSNTLTHDEFQENFLLELTPLYEDLHNVEYLYDSDTSLKVPHVVILKYSGSLDFIACRKFKEDFWMYYSASLIENEDMSLGSIDIDDFDGFLNILQHETENSDFYESTLSNDGLDNKNTFSGSDKDQSRQGELGTKKKIKKGINYIILDCEHISALDITGADTLKDIYNELKRRRVNLVLTGVPYLTYKLLFRIGFLTNNYVMRFKNIPLALTFILLSNAKEKYLVQYKNDHSVFNKDSTEV